MKPLVPNGEAAIGGLAGALPEARSEATSTLTAAATGQAAELLPTVLRSTVHIRFRLHSWSPVIN